MRTRPSILRALAATALGAMLLSSVADAGATQTQQFRTTVSRVRVDVIVNDRDGRFVDDLTIDDFELREDGRPQEILQATLIDLVDDRVLAVAAAAEPLPNVEPDGGSDASGQEYGAIVYVIDGQALGRRGRQNFAEGWNRLLLETDRFVFPRAAYVFDRLGRLVELSPLTTDIDQLRSVAQLLLQESFLEGTGLDALSEIPDNASDLERRIPRADPTTPGPLGASTAVLDNLDSIALSQGINTFEMIGELSQSLASRGGRKALVWVSSGLDLRIQTVGPFDPAGLGTAVNSAFEPDMRTKAAQELMHQLANTSNVSVYGVDPSLVTQRRSIGVATRTGNADSVINDQEELELFRADGQRDALVHAAEATGGRAYDRVGRAILSTLRDLETDNSRFYLLTYETPEPAGDGDYHDIDVRVSRRGVRVRGREGYIDLSETARAELAVGTALTIPGSATDVPFDVDTIAWLDADGSYRLVLNVGVRPAPEASAANLSAVSVHAGAYVDGIVVDRLDRRLVPDVERIADDEGGEPHPPRLSETWGLAPGEYDLRVAVRNEVTGRIGAVRIPVSVPGQCAAWCTSDPFLLRQGADRRISSVIDHRLRRGEAAAVMVQVFGGGRPILHGQIWRPGGDEPLAELPTVQLPRDGSGLHVGFAQVPTGLAPGRYELRVRVTDTGAARREVLDMEFEVTAD